MYTLVKKMSVVAYIFCKNLGPFHRNTANLLERKANASHLATHFSKMNYQENQGLTINMYRN